ncbi:hypothetical protein C8F04DRAFT_1259113 [Mycena alexandri]|uniref:Uncharacterized protein n=1 Tax=Mycena alexandri TaxID=1745969 RepID=A0AAD6X3H3_9AGAR|nr:hypothetical protein C8F04DRAFT_1259113 [Mycena alexandri]
MSSLDEVRTRIEELSFKLAIELQKQTLTDLERGLSSARRDLNAIFDPMAKSCPSKSHLTSSCSLSTTLLAFVSLLLLPNVYHLWMHIALSTPILWADLRSTDADGASFRKTFDIC